MRGKISALTLGVGLSALSCLVPAQARADLHLGFGTRWSPLRYTKLFIPGDSAKVLGTFGSDGFQTTSMDPYLALYFAQKYGLVLGLDIGYGKISSSTYPLTTGAMQVDNSGSYFQFGFGLGFKMYITQPRSQKISPYIYADFFKYIASISADPNLNDALQTAYYGSLLSPVGGTLAFGAEYFFTPGFSIGSEVFGLKIASSGGDQYTQGMVGGALATVKSHTDSYTYVTFYTGITLNYRFAIQTSIRATQPEETPDEDARKKKPQTQNTGAGDTPPPPPPPPPSPESVD